VSGTRYVPGPRVYVDGMELLTVMKETTPKMVKIIITGYHTVADGYTQTIHHGRRATEDQGTTTEAGAQARRVVQASNGSRRIATHTTMPN
jgi:hypothetical protein